MTKKGVSANENESSGVTVALVLISKLLPSFVLFPVASYSYSPFLHIYNASNPLLIKPYISFPRALRHLTLLQAGAAADLYDRPSVMTASCIVCAFFVAILGFIAEPSQLLLMYLVRAPSITSCIK